MTREPHRSWRAGRLATLLAAFVFAVVTAAPASAAYGPPAAPQPNPAFTMPLAGAVSATATTWATVVMGKKDGNFDLFWQLFSFDASTDHFSLATPPGVADNGGLIVAPDSANRTTLVGFGASQGLTFSPLARSTNNGKSWSGGSLPDALLTAPSAIGLSDSGHALALVVTHGERVLQRAGSLTSWKTLIARHALERTPAGQSCDIGDLEAVAYDERATPLVAASCQRPDTPGVFIDSKRQWHLADIPVPTRLAEATFATVRLGPASALFAAVHNRKTDLVAAWEPSSERPWVLSPPLQLASTKNLLASGTGPGTSQFVVIRARGGARAFVVSGPGKSWKALPKLPAGSATIAIEPNGGIAALAVRVATLSVFRLDGGRHWSRAQRIRVPIVFGSSG